MALPPAAWGLLPCAPSFQGLWLVAAAWHVLLRPCSPGQAAAVCTHLALSTSCSVVWCPDQSHSCCLPPYLQPTASHPCASSWVSVCLTAVSGCLPITLPAALVPATVLSSCLSSASLSGAAVPGLASSYKAVWLIPSLPDPFSDILPDATTHFPFPPASIPQECGLPLGPMQVRGPRVWE